MLESSSSHCTTLQRYLTCVCGLCLYVSKRFLTRRLRIMKQDSRLDMPLPRFSEGPRGQVASFCSKLAEEVSVGETEMDTNEAVLE